MEFFDWFRATRPEVSARSADAVLQLAAEGSTVPFIARYRKEQTGNLDEVAIQAVLEGKERFDEIVKRQAFLVEEIGAQQKLTPELKGRILDTWDLDALEDLYLPYKKKRKTKATLAKEAGLEPLARWLMDVGHGLVAAGERPEERAGAFLNAEAGYADAPAALAGAVEIVIERLSEDEALRQTVRHEVLTNGVARTTKGEKAKTPSRFETYFAHEEKIASLLLPGASHRYLAMRRGWLEEELSLTIGGPAKDADDPAGFDARLLAAFEAAAGATRATPAQTLLKKAARLALKAHVFPSIDAQVHKTLKEAADDAAIHVFAENVRKVLLSAPFGPKAVLGVDPGLRTGCKLALVDDAGTYVTSGLFHLHGEEARRQGRQLVAELVRKGNVRAVAVGNGTAGREAEAFVREALAAEGLNVPVVLVSEAGASIYSASEVARDEFPDLDLTIRGAISIARRLQDPLAELVKTDPKSIGVGQYQHDVAQNLLKKRLDLVVESAVNQVGVNLNTASAWLLSHVAGIGPSLGRAIVAHRQAKGLFRSRQQLLEVPRFTKKTFEQAAGFLRIPGGEHPLDATGVHPERYDVLERVAARMSRDLPQLLGAGATALRKLPGLVDELGVFTFEDVVAELEKPGRDPRETFVPFSFRDDVHELSDLVPGMVCPGLVTNVTNFGAFVDIGVHQDGLVHVSQLSDRFVKDPRQAVSPGDRVTARVLAVNLEKRQISLSLRSDAAPAQRPPLEQGRPARPAPRPEPSLSTLFGGRGQNRGR